MRRSLFTEEQIAFAMRPAWTGPATDDIRRKVGIGQAASYPWLRG